MIIPEEPAVCKWNDILYLMTLGDQVHVITDGLTTNRSRNSILPIFMANKYWLCRDDDDFDVHQAGNHPHILRWHVDVGMLTFGLEKSERTNMKSQLQVKWQRNPFKCSSHAQSQFDLTGKVSPYQSPKAYDRICGRREVLPAEYLIQKLYTTDQVKIRETLENTQPDLITVKISKSCAVENHTRPGCRHWSSNASTAWLKMVFQSNSSLKAVSKSLFPFKYLENGIILEMYFNSISSAWAWTMEHCQPLFSQISSNRPNRCFFKGIWITWPGRPS